MSRGSLDNKIEIAGTSLLTFNLQNINSDIIPKQYKQFGSLDNKIEIAGTSLLTFNLRNINSDIIPKQYKQFQIVFPYVNSSSRYKPFSTQS